MYMKPYDGGGWQGVSRLDDEVRLRESYEASGTHLMHLQQAVEPWDRFVRCIGLGPQTRVVRYDPAQPLHDRYTVDRDFVNDGERSLLEDMTLTINAFFNWDFNSCEALHRDGVWHPIDFANACPDSQVTSLHFHFPWLVMANLRWSLFCAATKRPMKLNQDWAPFFRVADSDLPYREKLRQWAAIAHQRFDTANFTAFCATHLPHLEQVTRDFFATEVARDAVRQKVAALYPAHEVETFTQMFWDRIQQWRESPIEPAVTATVPAAEKPMAAKAAAVVAAAMPTAPAPAAAPAPAVQPAKPAAAAPIDAPATKPAPKPRVAAGVRAAGARKTARAASASASAEADAAVKASVSKAAARAAKSLGNASDGAKTPGGSKLS